MERYRFKWTNETNIGGLRYICGYCGADTAPAKGYVTTPEGSEQGHVLLCTNCNRPTFAHRIDQQLSSITPAAKMGNHVHGLSPDVDEARQCTSAGAYTAAVLTCRKILMHVAVEKGAPAKQQFITYVEYLASQNYIPQEGKGWVDHIRTKSNEANHEIQVMSKEDAEDLITFTEMLLRLVYEFKNRLSRRVAPTP